MSAARDAFTAAVQAAVTDGPWEVANPSSVRYTETLAMPQAMRSWPGLHGGQPYRDWETYGRLVFISVTGGAPILRVCPAPWAECRDITISFRRAGEILADPAQAFG